MAYFPDLSPYDYVGKPSPSFLNVGWLDHVHPFNKGSVAPHLIEKLKALAAKPTKLTRGFHICELCPKSITRIPVLETDPRYASAGQDREGNRIFFPPEYRGNGEIHISIQDLFGASNSTPDFIPTVKIGVESDLVFVKKTTFAAPVLIAHYVETHNYLPPPEFLRTLEMHRME